MLARLWRIWYDGALSSETGSLNAIATTVYAQAVDQSKVIKI